jgi:FMN-binding protein
MNKKRIQFLVLSLLLISIETYAKGTYLEPELFLEQVFAGNLPKPDKIWITKEIKTDIKNILGHDLAVIRVRYWNDGSKTAWILEEIGRDKLITAGLVVKDKKIEQINVLIFRESRGWEVKYPFFTDQFKQASLIENNKLDRKIDGISGATLSVNALTRLAQLALYLDAQVNKK